MKKAKCLVIMVFWDVTDYTCLWKGLQTLGCARLRTEYSQVIWRPKETSGKRDIGESDNRAKKPRRPEGQ